MNKESLERINFGLKLKFNNVSNTEARKYFLIRLAISSSDIQSLYSNAMSSIFKN